MGEKGNHERQVVQFHSLFRAAVEWPEVHIKQIKSILGYRRLTPLKEQPPSPGPATTLQTIPPPTPSPYRQAARQHIEYSISNNRAARGRRSNQTLPNKTSSLTTDGYNETTVLLHLLDLMLDTKSTEVHSSAKQKG